MPVLLLFSFVGIHPSVEIYSLFHLDPMHVLSLGINKPLKECLVTTLGDSKRTKSVLKRIQVAAESLGQLLSL